MSYIKKKRIKMSIGMERVFQLVIKYYIIWEILP